jgi:SAM-dependent methyltransferase
MCSVTVFDEHAQEYDRWFDENARIYHAEVSAMQRFVPQKGTGVEIGVGTGRFAIRFGIQIGIEPARRMAQIAQSRGLDICQALGECLPFRDEQFDFALLVTVICFVEDVALLLRETRRALRTGGRIVIGFIDRNSALGQLYESRKDASKFYRDARFYSVAQVAEWTRQAGFGGIQFCQTLCGLPGEMSDQVRDGYGEGAFVVLSAQKK